MASDPVPFLAGVAFQELVFAGITLSHKRGLQIQSQPWFAIRLLAQERAGLSVSMTLACGSKATNLGLKCGTGASTMVSAPDMVASCATGAGRPSTSVNSIQFNLPHRWTTWFCCCRFRWGGRQQIKFDSIQITSSMTFVMLIFFHFRGWCAALNHITILCCQSVRLILQNLA